MPARFLRYARVEPGVKSGYPFTLPVVGWLSQNRELVLPGPNGLYVLDEPEAALSVRGCMALLARIADLAERNCQVLIATHSPILLALPGATILEIGDDGAISRVSYDEALPVRLTREFLAAPERLLRILLDDR